MCCPEPQAQGGAGGGGAPLQRRAGRPPAQGVRLPPPSASCTAWQGRAGEEGWRGGRGRRSHGAEADRKRARGHLRSKGQSEGRQSRGSAYAAAHPPTEGSTRGSEATGVCEGHRGQRADRKRTKSSRGGLHGRSSRERVGPRPPPRAKQQRCPQGTEEEGSG